MSLPDRKIGDVSVPAIGFGAMGISTAYGAIESDEDRFKVLDAAYEKGCRHWDTSDLYGDSEDLIGKFKRTGKRDDIFLATKFGFTMNGIRGDAEFVKEAAARSLKRLGIDTIDLYYAHRVDSNTPIEVTVGAMAELVKEGKVKYIGISDCSTKALRRAHAVHPIAALQIEFSPFVLDIYDPKLALLETARELGITAVVYSPLARGLVTGQYKSQDEFDANDFRRTIPKFSQENFPKILEVVSRIQEIGKKHNATAGQVTLSWILAQGHDIVVIPGTKKTKYLEENVNAASVKLTNEEIEELWKISKEADIPGERYAPDNLQLTYVDTPELPK